MAFRRRLESNESFTPRTIMGALDRANEPLHLRMWAEKRAGTSGASACAATSCVSMVRLILGIVCLSMVATYNTGVQTSIGECRESALWLNVQGASFLALGIAGLIVALAEAIGGCLVIFLLATDADPEGPVMRRVYLARYIVRGMVGLAWGFAEVFLFGWSIYGMVYFFTAGEDGAPEGCEEIYQLGYTWTVLSAIASGSLGGMILVILGVVCIVLSACGGAAGIISLIRGATKLTTPSMSARRASQSREDEVVARLRRRESATGGAAERAIGQMVRSESKAAIELERRSSAKSEGDLAGRFRARWAFKAAQPDELSFEKGAVLVHVSRSKEHMEQWATGTVEGTGVTGLFPLNYVALVKEAAAANGAAAAEVGEVRAIV